MFDGDRCRGVCRVALVGETERGRTVTADQQFRLPARIEEVEKLLSCSLDSEDGDWVLADYPHRLPAPQRGNRRPESLLPQASISQISGTWSDGRSQLRQGSRTTCLLRWPESSGEAHM